MTDNMILEALQKFLIDNVSSKIKLQEADAQNNNNYKLVNPQVHIGYIPPNNYLPEGMEASIPCLIIGFDDGSDDGEEASLNAKISFAIYNPGRYGTDGKLIPNFEGYKDLLNLISLTKRKLAEKLIIEDTATVEKPFKWGIYQEQPYPYWYGWLTFNVKCALTEYVPDIAQQYL